MTAAKKRTGRNIPYDVNHKDESVTHRVKAPEGRKIKTIRISRLAINAKETSEFRS